MYQHPCNLVVFLPWSWLSLSLGVCSAEVGCVCVSLQQTLFGLHLTSNLLSSPRGALVSVWPYRAILLVIHAHWGLIGPRIYTLSHTEAQWGRNRNKTHIETHIYALSALFFACVTATEIVCDRVTTLGHAWECTLKKVKSPRRMSQSPLGRILLPVELYSQSFASTRKKKPAVGNVLQMRQVVEYGFVPGHHRSPLWE